MQPLGTHIAVVSRNTLLRAGIIQILANVDLNASLSGYSYHDLDRHPDPSATIDLLLVSIASPERLSSLVMASLRAFMPLKVILLAEWVPDVSMLSALPKQVAGFIDQASPAEVFVENVQRVLAGGTCFPREQNSMLTELSSSRKVPFEANPDLITTTSTFIEAGSALVKSVAEQDANLLGLTPRQYEVLILLSQGHALKSVARILDISLGTTKAHTESIYQRLGAHNRNQAVHLARSKGASLD